MITKENGCKECKEMHEIYELHAKSKETQNICI